MNAARSFTLLAIVALHLAAIFFWPGPGKPASPGGRAETDIAFVKVLEPPRARPQAPPRPEKAAVAHTAPPPRVKRDPDFAAPPEPVAVAPAAPPVDVTPTPGDIMARARADIGAIDRDLRKSSLNMADRKLLLAPSKRETLIAEAFVERGPTPMIEEVMADGRRRMRRGNMCAYKESNGGVVGGRDVFRDGIKTRWEQCPR